MAAVPPPVYQIYYDAAQGYVRMDWNGYATSAQFREGTEYMLKLLVEHGAHKVLADIKTMTLIGQEDQNYVKFNFLPRAIERGFRAIALVRPSNYFNALAVEAISYRVQQTSVQIRLFDSLEEAQTWLQQVSC
ncbi:SpoIIAA family protein [Dawidia soli]|uniref:STAS/SEC14 domain-containing protein n=1 Tax=Dawidia soli TaxID=2782352 RepID=A0AAP2GK58_9BACT|nr:STAS/SEC14 domain-containing protein [Dawidia soli]MBT1689270.1 STAS/SEC14 domain-containing protein [Dawidia soli]